MDGLSDKIRAFLADTGFDFDGDRASNLQLIEYFQKEYGLEVMGLMEQEWLEEQMERDISTGLFKDMREQVDDDQLDAFDRDVRRVVSRPGRAA